VYITEIDHDTPIEQVTAIVHTGIVSTLPLNRAAIVILLEQNIRVFTLRQDNDNLHSAKVIRDPSNGNEFITTTDNDTTKDNLRSLPLIDSPETIRITTIEKFNEIRVRLGHEEF
jgi:hypothetical protein